MGDVSLSVRYARGRNKKLCWNFIWDGFKEALEVLGIFVIPVGEIENFCPEVGLHGPKFVTKLLTEIPLGDQRLQKLREFVSYTHN